MNEELSGDDNAGSATVAEIVILIPSTHKQKINGQLRPQNQSAFFPSDGQG